MREIELPVKGLQFTVIKTFAQSGACGNGKYKANFAALPRDKEIMLILAKRRDDSRALGLVEVSWVL